MTVWKRAEREIRLSEVMSSRLNLRFSWPQVYAELKRPASSAGGRLLGLSGGHCRARLFRGSAQTMRKGPLPSLCT
jgi:hypothetical protein